MFLLILTTDNDTFLLIQREVNKMVKLVAMFNLPPGTDEAEFEKYFVKKHARGPRPRFQGCAGI